MRVFFFFVDKKLDKNGFHHTFTVVPVSVKFSSNFIMKFKFLMKLL